jgi:hypothetical protein
MMISTSLRMNAGRKAKFHACAGGAPAPFERAEGGSLATPKIGQIVEGSLYNPLKTLVLQLKKLRPFAIFAAILRP